MERSIRTTLLVQEVKLSCVNKSQAAQALPKLNGVCVHKSLRCFWKHTRPFYSCNFWHCWKIQRNKNLWKYLEDDLCVPTVFWTTLQLGPLLLLLCRRALHCHPGAPGKAGANCSVGGGLKNLGQEKTFAQESVLWCSVPTQIQPQ